MISINLTIYNQEGIIREVLNRIKTYTSGDYEIVTVVDGCTDRTEEYVDDFISNNPDVNIKKIITPDLNEVKANNIAAKNSIGDYIIILHGDMLVNEKDWNLRILKPLKKYDDIFAVTARCAHNWKINTNSLYLNPNNSFDDFNVSHYMPPGLQRGCSDLLLPTDDTNSLLKNHRDKFFIRSCVNRGPLAIDKEVFDFMGGFDEKFAPYDMDDHDFCFRTYKELGKKCGAYDIDIITDLRSSPTKDQFKGQTNREYKIQDQLKKETGGNFRMPPDKWIKSNHKNTKIVYTRHKEIIESNPIKEERHCQ